jgi:pimeloyl-ACP methyl ester carboxylesterase
MTEMPDKTPTIVLVHGAFAESASWDGVTDRLLADGRTGGGVRQPRCAGWRPTRRC